MISGYSNEKRFVEVFNDKFIYQLEEKYIKLLEDIYERKLDRNSYVICWKPVVNEKADIIIRVGSEKKRLSIKTGKNNSVHMEKLPSFINFLKDLGCPDEAIVLYKDFHYAVLEKGKRISSKEYQDLFPERLEMLNAVFNKEIDLIKVFDRFLFEGLNCVIDFVDVLVYGSVDNYKLATRKVITEYLLNYKDEFLAPHFSALVLQPWARNLNNNEKHDYRREYVQVKWYRLEEVFDKIKKEL